ncbi:MAG: hypothetical protein HOP09_03735 [Hyphomicrobium sp.]|nr:hypothetical protein [Hyphomicrobium sp.]
MTPKIDPDALNGPAVAQSFCEASDVEFLDIFHRLRARHELTAAVHSLGELLSDAEYGAAARNALRRIGLENGG